MSVCIVAKILNFTVQTTRARTQVIGHAFVAKCRGRIGFGFGPIGPGQFRGRWKNISVDRVLRPPEQRWPSRQVVFTAVIMSRNKLEAFLRRETSLN